MMGLRGFLFNPLFPLEVRTFCFLLHHSLDFQRLLGGFWLGIASPVAEVAKGQSAENSEQQGGRGSGKKSLNLGEQSLL